MNDKYLKGYFEAYVLPSKASATYEDWVSKISKNEDYKRGMFNTHVVPARRDAVYEDWDAKVFGSSDLKKKDQSLPKPTKQPSEPSSSTQTKPSTGGTGQSGRYSLNLRPSDIGYVAQSDATVNIPRFSKPVPSSVRPTGGIKDGKPVVYDSLTKAIAASESMQFLNYNPVSSEEMAKGMFEGSAIVWEPKDVISPYESFNQKKKAYERQGRSANTFVELLDLSDGAAEEYASSSLAKLSKKYSNLRGGDLDAISADVEAIYPMLEKISNEYKQLSAQKDGFVNNKQTDLANGVISKMNALLVEHDKIKASVGGEDAIEVVRKIQEINGQVEEFKSQEVYSELSDMMFKRAEADVLKSGLVGMQFMSTVMDPIIRDLVGGTGYLVGQLFGSDKILDYLDVSPMLSKAEPFLPDAYKGSPYQDGKLDLGKAVPFIWKQAVNMAPMMAAGIATQQYGATAAGLAAGLATFATTYDDFYNEAQTEARKKGINITHGQLSLLSAINASSTAAIEQINPLERVFKGRLIKGSIQKAITDIAEGRGINVAINSAKQAGKEMLKIEGLEIFEELLDNAKGQVVSTMTNQALGSDFETEGGNIAEIAVNTAIATLPFAGMGGVTSGTRYKRDLYHSAVSQGMTESVLAKFAENTDAMPSATMKAEVDAIQELDRAYKAIPADVNENDKYEIAEKIVQRNKLKDATTADTPPVIAEEYKARIAAIDAEIEKIYTAKPAVEAVAEEVGDSMAVNEDAPIPIQQELQEDSAPQELSEPVITPDTEQRISEIEQSLSEDLDLEERDSLTQELESLKTTQVEGPQEVALEGELDPEASVEPIAEDLAEPQVANAPESKAFKKSAIGRHSSPYKFDEFKLGINEKRGKAEGYGAYIAADESATASKFTNISIKENLGTIKDKVRQMVGRDDSKAEVRAGNLLIDILTKRSQEKNFDQKFDIEGYIRDQKAHLSRPAIPYTKADFDMAIELYRKVEGDFEAAFIYDLEYSLDGDVITENMVKDISPDVLDKIRSISPRISEYVDEYIAMGKGLDGGYYQYLYDAISRDRGSPKAASDALTDVGIIGQSRDGNILIYSDENVKTLSRQEVSFRDGLSEKTQLTKPLSQPMADSAVEPIVEDLGDAQGVDVAPITLSEVEKIPFEDRTDKQHADFIRQKFVKEFSDKGVPKEQVEAAVALMDARAKIANPDNPDAYFRKIEDIGKGEFQESSMDILYQVIDEINVFSSNNLKEAKDFIDKAFAATENKEEVKQVYRKIAIKYHPDKNTTSSATDIMQHLNSIKEKYDNDKIDNRRASSSWHDSDFMKGWESKQQEEKRKEETKAKKDFDYYSNNKNKPKQSFFDKLFGKETKESSKFKAYSTYNKEIQEAKNNYSERVKKAQSRYDEIINDLGSTVTQLMSAGTEKTNEIFYSEAEYNKAIMNAKSSFRKSSLSFQDKKGAVETLTNGRKIIHALDAPDFSTAVHEIAHIFEGELSSSDKKVIQDWAKTKGWTTETSEAFARGFERYLRDGNAPTPELKTIFQQAKEWLRSIYQSLKGSAVEKKITPEVKQVFDNLFAAVVEETPDQKAEREAVEKESLEKVIAESTVKIKSPDTDAEQTLVRQFQAIPSSFFAGLSNRRLKKISNALATLNDDPSQLGVIREALDLHNGKILGDEILDADNDLGRAVAEVAVSDGVQGVIEKTKDPEVGTSKESLSKKIAQKVLYQIDRVVGGIKNNTVYTNMVNGLLSKHEASQKNLEDDIDRPLIKLLEKAKKSRAISAFRESEFAMKVTFYVNELQHQSNIQADEDGKESSISTAPSISTIISAMTKTAGEYSKEQIKFMGGMLQKYADPSTGKVDIDRMYKLEFNSAEKAVMSFMRDSLDNNIRQKFTFMDNSYRKGDAKLVDNYFPRKTVNTVEVVDADDYLGALMSNGETINSNAAKKRSDTAPAIDLNPFSSFLNAAKEAYIQYYVVPELHTIKAIRKHIEKNGDPDSVAAINAINKALGDIIYFAYKMPKIQEKGGLLEAMANSAMGNVAVNMLISPRRLVNEVFTNAFTFGMVNIKSILKNKDGIKAINKDVVNKIQRMFGSTQLERINRGGFQTDAKTYDQDMQIGGAYNIKEKGAKGFMEWASVTARDAFRNGTIKKINRGLTRTYYRVADSTAPLIWKAGFSKEFKKISGAAFDAEAFNNSDNVYADEHKMHIRKAIAIADQDVSTQFQSASQLEQKLKVQQDKADSMLKHTMLNYMQSFAYSENQALRDAAKSLIGKGGMEKDKAAAIMVGITARAYGYQLMGQLLLEGAKAGLGMGDDEEELKEILKRESIDATFMFALLASIGNKNAIVKTASFVALNMALAGYKNYKGDYFDPYKDAVGFSPNASSPDLLKSIGPVGTILSVGERSIKSINDLAIKATSENGLDREDVVTLQNSLLALDVTALALGLPAKSDISLLLKAHYNEED